MQVTKSQNSNMPTTYRIENNGRSVTLSPREWEILYAKMVTDLSLNSSQSGGGVSPTESLSRAGDVERGDVLYLADDIIDHFSAKLMLMSDEYQTWFKEWVKARVQNSGYKTDKRTLAGWVDPSIKDDSTAKDRKAQNYTFMLRKWEKEFGLGVYHGNNVFKLSGETWGLRVNGPVVVPHVAQRELM